jgi:hypothetical protein
VLMNSRFAKGRFLGVDDLSFFLHSTVLKYKLHSGAFTFLQDKPLPSREHAKFHLWCNVNL